ncbi:hypothetical protein TI04_03000 [Achromatium sp. WMS2]|nr:hypothetical protein TI04_03000 [Achromatium sp. WMS2]
MTATHDLAYKKLFSHPEMVIDLINGYVKEEWVKQLDFSTLERVNETFVTDDFREREDDMIWRVRFGERWLYLYLLIEFQSTVDKFMAVRLMTYIGLLWQSLICSKNLDKSNSKALLSPVLPIVLYNGSKRWWAPTVLSELLEPELPAELAKFQPQLSYLLLDEGRYAKHPLPEVRNLVAAIFKLENSRSEEDVTQVLKLLLKWLDDPSEDALRRAFVTWLNSNLLQRILPNTRLSANVELQEVHDMLAEWLDQLAYETEQRGRQEGMHEGIIKGRQEGATIAKRQTLQKILHQRFHLKQLPDWVEVRLANAGIEDLERWIDRLFQVQTLEEIFKDLSD